VDVSYTYDAFVSGSNYGRGYRTGMSDASGSANWVIDPRGRVTEELKTLGMEGFKTQWGYNSNDSLAWMKYPAGNTGTLGEQVNYSYHPQGLLNTLVNNSGYIYVQATSYDAAGRVELRSLRDSLLQTDYTYFGWGEADGQGRLKRVASGLSGSPTSLQDLRYSDTLSGAAWYDSMGNLLQIADYKAGVDPQYPQLQSFTYDEADRILTAAATGGASGNYSETYTYNGTTGNLSTKAGVTYTYGDAAHKHAVTATSNGNSYGYNGNGSMNTRLVGGVSYTLGYDAENHLTTVSGGTTATFVYDGDGKRVKATVGGTTTVYIGDYFEWTGSSSTMIKYFSANGQRVALKKGSTVYLLFGDHLGSTAITANSTTGALVGELRYKAWGEQRHSSGTTYTNRRYTGQLRESSLGGVEGLYFYNSRWYDSYLNRWTSPDPIIPDPYNTLDWDRYSYARNNPVKYVDPDGHFPILPLLGILLFLATLPGDTGPYDVSPSTTAIGNAGLRMVDPVDWAYTAGECFSGNCSGIDIAFGLLPVVNGGLDDAADAARAL
jgi:RHS repeat-associated protein